MATVTASAHEPALSPGLRPGDGRAEETWAALSDLSAACDLVRDRNKGAPAELVTALGRHLHELACTPGLGVLAAQWWISLPSEVTREAFDWIMHSASRVPVDDTGDLVARLAGSLGSRMGEYRSKAVNSGAPDSAYEAGFFWPHPLLDPPVPEGFIEWLLSVSWGFGDYPLSRVRAVVESWRALSAVPGEVAPRDLSDAVLRSRELVKNGIGGDSSLATAFVAAGGGADRFRDTYRAWLDGFASVNLPLPRGVLRHGDYVARFLTRSDPCGVLLGHLTCCSQSVGSRRAGAAVHGQHDPRGGFLAVEDDRGCVVGHAWIRMGTDSSSWCFDSVVVAAGILSAREYAERCAAVAALVCAAGKRLAELTGLPVTLGVDTLDQDVLPHLETHAPGGSSASQSGLGNELDGDYLLCPAPAHALPWRMTSVQARGTRWECADGTVLEVCRNWDERGPVTTKVAVLAEPGDSTAEGAAWTPADGMDGHAADALSAAEEVLRAPSPGWLEFASALAGADALNVVAHDGQDLYAFGADELGAGTHVGAAIAERASLYGQWSGHLLGAIATEQDNLEKVLARGLTPGQVAQILFATRAPVSDLATLIEEGVDARALEMIGESDVSLDDVRDLLRAGMSSAEVEELVRERTPLASAVELAALGVDARASGVLARAGVPADAVSAFMGEGGTLAQAVEFVSAGVPLSGTVAAFLDRVGNPEEVAELARRGLPVDTDTAELLAAGGTAEFVADLSSMGADLAAAAAMLQDGCTEEDIRRWAAGAAPLSAAREWCALLGPDRADIVAQAVRTGVDRQHVAYYLSVSPSIDELEELLGAGIPLMPASALRKAGGSHRQVMEMVSQGCAIEPVGSFLSWGGSVDLALTVAAHGASLKAAAFLLRDNVSAADIVLLVESKVPLEGAGALFKAGMSAVEVKDTVVRGWSLPDAATYLSMGGSATGLLAAVRGGEAFVSATSALVSRSGQPSAGTGP